MKYFLAIFLLLIPFLACSIKTPEFTITGQKTALEQQVLGSYKNLTENTIVTTSARTGGGAGEENPQKQAIFDAVQSRKFNKDEIDEFKREKVIGENNSGYVQVLTTPKYETDTQYKKLVDALVEQENHDRRIIYQRVLVMSQTAADQENKTNAIFANVQIEESAAGTMIQLNDGSWIEKAAEKK